tara:strand:+ start:28 stop:318 length:291 start_codon:yes stop_codon:yes gene_type:complete
MNRRNCGVVITEMLTKVPKIKDNVELIEALNWHIEDASYKAPEETLQWERTMNTLQKYIPKPKEEWQFEVLSIFTTQPIEAIKSAVNFQKDKNYGK